MMHFRNLAALLALSSVAALPACSMFGGGDDSGRSSRASGSSYSSQSYATAPNYSTQPQQSMASTEMTPDMIRSVQQTLAQEGMYRGRVDGMWGPATQAGVRSYQQQHNMNATGQLDQDTLAAMNLGGSQNSAQQQPSSQRYGSNYNSPSGAGSNMNPGGGTNSNQGGGTSANQGGGTSSTR